MKLHQNWWVNINPHIVVYTLIHPQQFIILLTQTLSKLYRSSTFSSHSNSLPTYIPPSLSHSLPPAHGKFSQRNKGTRRGGGSETSSRNLHSGRQKWMRAYVRETSPGVAAGWRNQKFLEGAATSSAAAVAHLSGVGIVCYHRLRLRRHPPHINSRQHR